jgi:hypothetical protein
MDNAQNIKRNNQNEEIEKVVVLTGDQMRRTRLVDYIAIVLALGTVFILWLFQWMGLY